MQTEAKKITGQATDFDLRTTEKGELIGIINPADPYQMNWVKSGFVWGQIHAIEGLMSTVQRHLHDDRLTETYTFTNSTDFPITTMATQVGIDVPLPDYYTQASVGLTQCSNTHIWCGETCSYLMALRQGGQAPHLGMILHQGALKGYSIERSYDFSGREEEVSNNRGIIRLHPQNFTLQPGESYVLSWDLFWFESKAQFKDILRITPGYIDVTADDFVVTDRQPIVFQFHFGGTTAPVSAPQVTWHGQPLDVTWQGSNAQVTVPMNVIGSQRFVISWQNQRTHADFFRTLPLVELLSRRVHFIAEHQQCHDSQSILNGAYLIYDNAEHQQYYSHLNDHNGGRERVGMGVLMAYYLRHFSDERLMNSLDQYQNYLLNNLVNIVDGTVYNDAGRNNDDPRLYNYPWVAQFFLEMYQLKHDSKYLEWCFRVLTHFYEIGGIEFYAIGIPMAESIQLFRQAGRDQQAEQLLTLFRQNVDYIVKNGLNYPESEVSYEQAIVGPATLYVVDMYRLTGESRYLTAAKQQLAALDQFQGFQPDYHLNEVALRHWDDYWFGKQRMLGDTFPHYWTALSGLAFAHAQGIVGAERYAPAAHKSLRAPLSLFHEDGSASCAMVYPLAVNQRPAHCQDPWANDQDWGLYFAMKYRQ
ncbi:hypothetical protein [Levilactobacillus namurensis]|uniref:hypothetical protein n=1 Tax=Levilactobacillus namurensis TaxID=380393 RepID=UPI001DE51E7B|nr:hypothetical protein [Levilactobacillus namurensis]HJE45507.1 hypothetical protein [Levilactobacillus namurensis]